MKILKHLTCSMVLIVSAAGVAAAGARDYCEVHGEREAALCSYEPTTLGVTNDSDDTAFMDFKLSVSYQLFPKWITRVQNWAHDGLGEDSALYFAFTGRFGQYIGSRDSSPVVEKLFNPKLFYRYWTDDDHRDRVDVAFAHQSNGQSIDSPEEYLAALATSKNAHEVKDQLSRGWDYWEIAWKKTWHEREKKQPEAPAGPCADEACRKAREEAACDGTCRDCDSCRGIGRRESMETSIVSYLGVKFFLPRGPFEGAQENYNDWENDPEGKPLNKVSGLSALIKWTEQGTLLCFSDLKVAARFETGMREMFRYKTFRFEIGTKFLQLPLSYWRQTGYNSDLAQYYKKVRSYGIQAEIGSF